MGGGARLGRTAQAAGARVVGAGDRHSRVVWIADLLPHEAAPAIAGMMEEGLAIMKPTLEAA